jgi:hypothetical protein
VELSGKSEEVRETGLDAVISVLRRHDPEGLLAMGAPQDEYDYEATDLAALVGGVAPPLEAAVETIWRRAFGDRHHLQGELLRVVTDDLRALHFGEIPGEVE